MEQSGGTEWDLRGASSGPSGLAPELALLSIPAVAALVGDSASGKEVDGPRVAARLDRWLTGPERTLYHSFHLPKRRREWLAGRLAAKDLIRHRHGLDGARCFQRIEVRALTEGPQRGRPVYTVEGRPGEYCLSISHSGEMALAALARRSPQMIGVDLEAVEERDGSFETLVLSPKELRRLRGIRARARSFPVTLLWVFKEALVKALGTGLRLALPLVTVDLRPRSNQLGTPPFSVMKTILVHQKPGTADLAKVVVGARAFALGGRLAAWVTLAPLEET